MTSGGGVSLVTFSSGSFPVVEGFARWVGRTSAEAKAGEGWFERRAEFFWVRVSKDFVMLLFRVVGRSVVCGEMRLKNSWSRVRYVQKVVRSERERERLTRCPGYSDEIGRVNVVFHCAGNEWSQPWVVL